MQHKPVFRIFLSSPGDVPQERDDAAAVVNALNESGEFKNHFDIELLRWDDPNVVIPMEATDIPQRSVNVYLTLPSTCDLVVVIFWSRMGMPLVMDEREYFSGTHYEYSEGMAGFKAHGRPRVWLYRCTEEPLVSQKDPLRDEKNRQFDRVEQFFKQFLSDDGRLLSGVNEYPTHAAFKDRFKGQLLTYLRHLRDNPPASPPDTSSTPIATTPRFTGKPYNGLPALTEDDSAIFFGRELETLELLNRVETRRLVAVLGASGSGKSSLVAAGVLPVLRKRNWRIVRCVPTDDPFYSVACAMISQLPEFGIRPADYLTEARKVADALRTAPDRLSQQLRLTLPHGRILLFIDQFEEVFTLAEKNPRLQAGEVQTFLQAVQQAAAEMTTLLTMRADFYETALPHLNALEQETFGLKRPTIYALYEMITRPAELAGLAFDPGLARRIVAEVGADPGALALVAYLMEALYLRSLERDDKRLMNATYDDLGGVKGAINTLAARAYAALPFADEAKKSALRRVFRDLIALTEEDGQLIPTRRRGQLDHFLPGSDERRLIDAFAAPSARLLVIEGHGVEVAHEAVLRYWAELADWIATVKGDLALVRQYERDAQTWHNRGRQDPPPTHEALVNVYKAFQSLNMRWEDLPEPFKSYTEPEADRLQRELKDLRTIHIRRVEIGDRLNIIGDPRLGVGVLPDGTPDMAWCLVTPGGEIEIENHKF